MNNPLTIFKIKKEERWIALAVLMLAVGLNALMIGSQWELYTKPLLHGGSWTAFQQHFEMSGYDCWSWLMLTEGKVFFDTLRHPLYFSLLYPLYLLNHWLMSVTGFNWAVFMMASVLVCCTTYSGVFVYRILRELLSVGRIDATLLVLMLFSFGHVMVPAMVPDHFMPSMMLLTLTAYACGRKMRMGRTFRTWQAALMLFLTSGMAASNGAKTILAALFANGRRFFRPQFLAVAIVLPLVVLLAVQRYQYHAFEVPQAEKIHHIERENAKKMTAEDLRKRAEHKQWMKDHDMQSADEEGLLRLMDFKTPRIPILIENALGESFLLHKSHALEDELKTRPMIVHYQSRWPYAVTLLITSFFILGLWLGRKNRLMQMLSCWLCVDVVLNIILGFAINEVYIMTTGWAFTIPVAIAFLFKTGKGKGLTVLRIATATIVFLLFTSNIQSIAGHLFP